MAATILALQWDAGLKVRALLLENGMLAFNYLEGCRSAIGGKVSQSFVVDENGHASADARPWKDVRTEVRTVYPHSSLKAAGITNIAYWFNGFSNLQLVSGFENLSGVEDVTQLFASCSELRTVSATSFDNSKIKRYAGVLYGCSKLVGGTDGSVPSPSSGAARAQAGNGRRADRPQERHTHLARCHAVRRRRAEDRLRQSRRGRTRSAGCGQAVLQRQVQRDPGNPLGILRQERQGRDDRRRCVEARQREPELLVLRVQRARVGFRHGEPAGRGPHGPHVQLVLRARRTRPAGHEPCGAREHGLHVRSLHEPGQDPGRCRLGAAQGDAQARPRSTTARPSWAATARPTTPSRRRARYAESTARGRRDTSLPGSSLGLHKMVPLATAQVSFLRSRQEWARLPRDAG